MVKMYLKDKDEYFDIKYTSILKAYALGWLGFMIIIVVNLLGLVLFFG